MVHVMSKMVVPIITDSAETNPKNIVQISDVKRRKGGPGRKPKKRGRASLIAMALKGTGLAGRFRCTMASLEAIYFPAAQAIRNGDTCPPPVKEVQQIGALLSPVAYSGQRINRTARTAGVQSASVIPPPKLPAPWQRPTDVLGGRDWSAYAAHVSASIQCAVGRRIEVLLVRADELSGPLLLRLARGSSLADYAHAATRGRNVAAATAALQQRADTAEACIVHDDMDVLVFSATSEVTWAMRRHLKAIGSPAAVDALSLAARLDSPDGRETLAWMRTASEKRACPNSGSSHTGVTVDFGIHDGQQSSGGGEDTHSHVPDALRGARQLPHTAGGSHWSHENRSQVR